MVQRRAKAAGIETRICNHTFRATGITVYLSNGGSVEKAQQMANHSDPRTTKLYDRRCDEVSLDVDNANTTIESEPVKRKPRLANWSDQV